MISPQFHSLDQSYSVDYIKKIQKNLTFEWEKRENKLVFFLKSDFYEFWMKGILSISNKSLDNCFYLFYTKIIKNIDCEGIDMNCLPSSTTQLNKYFFSYFRSCL